MRNTTKRYKCIKEFYIYNYNIDNESSVEKFSLINIGSIWHISNFDFVDCEISLENEDKCSHISWIGCNRAILEQNFKEINCEVCR